MIEAIITAAIAMAGGSRSHNAATDSAMPMLTAVTIYPSET